MALLTALFSSPSQPIYLYMKYATTPQETGNALYSTNTNSATNSDTIAASEWHLTWQAGPIVKQHQYIIISRSVSKLDNKYEQGSGFLSKGTTLQNMQKH